MREVSKVEMISVDCHVVNSSVYKLIQLYLKLFCKSYLNNIEFKKKHTPVSGSERVDIALYGACWNHKFHMRPQETVYTHLRPLHQSEKNLGQWDSV